MEKVFFVSQNRHKFDEIKRILAGHGISLAWEKLALIEPDFASLEEIAKYKAKQAFEKTRKPVVVEDTGVFFEAFNSFPGVMAKRVFNGIGFDGLCALIRSVKNKRAYFETVICYSDGARSFKCFSGKLHGTLVDSPRAIEADRLPYEKLFMLDGYTKVLAEISVEEKNRISHRGIAAQKLGHWLSKKT
ncbi:MAG: non-canonical purine NTP pyrophosphatase [Candidatus Diapherotrites archaeon]|nr:non-canonical purine NTP pyrophosphatase [Candidatus Diapherotrites archaeon]